MKCKRNSQRQRGSVLVTTLFMIVVTSILLVGVGIFVSSHHTRVQSDSSYARALDLAEAGLNYQMRKISLGTDYSNSTVNLGGGTFTAQCLVRGTNTPWTPAHGYTLEVLSTATVNGVPRAVRASLKGYPFEGRYAIYTMDSVSVWNGSSISIVGDIGSNGKYDFSGHPGVSGNVYFNGPNAGWHNNVDPGGYSVVRNGRPAEYKTVDQIALEMFPNSGPTAPGGMEYLALNNSNANAVPPIVNNSITDSVTLKGPGNYYLTNINLSGNKKITLDNSAGPINIWVGPSGGSGTCRFRGGTAAIPISSDPTKQCSIYVATQTGIDLAGNERIDALIYAYNRTPQGNAYGYVRNSGNPIVNGQILANEVDINGNITVNYIRDIVKPGGASYFGFDNSWVEVNPR